MSLEARPTGADRRRPLSEWSDEELVAEFRHTKDEVTHEGFQTPDRSNAPAGALEDELRRRGLEPDREDVIPDAPSSGRPSSSTPSRGTAPDAGEESSG
jgi:hypothetical protein